MDNEDQRRLEFRAKPHAGPQEMFLTCIADIALYGGSAGSGKLLPLDLPIPTPYGWKLNGELVAGDEVFGRNGQVIRVLKAWPIQTPRKSYELEFDDGSVLTAADTHLWLTYDAKELAALTRLSEGFRARRRSRRPSRVCGRKSRRFTEAVRARNSLRNHEYKPAPEGTVRTTETIVNSLRTASGRVNHAIPVCLPAQCPHVDVPLDPYVLGVWLGDGCATESQVTSADAEVIEQVRRAGWNVTRHSDPISFGIPGLRRVLKRLGVFGNKHVPAVYLRSSQSQRLALLQGLMDTDGHATKQGTLEFTSTNRRLAEAVHELACSLGSKVSRSEGRAMLYGRDCGPKYRVRWSASYPCFRLPRKAARQRIDGHRRTIEFRYVVGAKEVKSVPMRCITVDSADGLYLCGRSFIPTHNTWALLIEAVRHINNPDWGTVIFRRTCPRITNEGGLWDESLKLYPLLQGRPSGMDWRFPSGASVQFRHLEYEKTLQDWHGSQVGFIGFDELTEFTERQFFYMLSRNRSTCGIRPYVRATTNPDSESWVLNLVKWYLTPEGYPDPAKAGVLRWFIRVDDELTWYMKYEEAVAFAIRSGVDPLRAAIMPKSFTFIPGKLEDNPTLDLGDPGYRANLMALPLVDRERLLGGNWKIRPAAGLVFPRSAWKFSDAAPVDVAWIRAWDKATTATGTGPRTAGVLVGYQDSTSRWFIGDCVAGRWADMDREATILATAELDRKRYGEVPIVLEIEPGSGGKDSGLATVRMLRGFDVSMVRVTGKKPSRWRPLASQVQAGNVSIIKGDWDWDDFIRELDALSGDEKMDESRLKDCADAAGLGFNAMAGSMDEDVVGDLLASGGPTDAKGPVTEEEMRNLPAHLREMLAYARSSRGGSERFGGRDFD